jgi:hypothetical protein
MTSPEVSEERLEALLAGAAPATPAEEELVAVMIELRGEPASAPPALRARVGALAAAPTAMDRVRAAFTGAGLRRTILVAAPACSLALAAGVVIGLGQRPSPAPPAPETTMLTATDARTAVPPAARPGDAARTSKGGGNAAAPDEAPAPASAPSAPAQGFAPEFAAPGGGGGGAATPAPAPAAPRGGDDLTAQGSGARVVPNAADAEDREAARAEALADALQDAAAKARRAADQAGVKLGPPEAVAVDSPPQAPATCAPAPATGSTAAPVAPAPPPPASAPAPATGAPAAGGACTVAADVSVTYPTQTGGTTASAPPPAP